MYEDLEYGPVLITKGPMKGHIGYYDDDDEKNMIIFYPRGILYSNYYYLIKRSDVTSIIPNRIIVQRLSQLDQIVCNDAYGIEKRTEEEIIDALNERILCADLLSARYISALQHTFNQGKTNVFISHSSKDIVFSKGLATDLLEAGLSVFLDEWSIDIGDRIFDKINEGLSESTAFIMILSQNYLKSACCNDEWGAFYGKLLHNENCRIYPVIIDDSEPPALLSQIKYLKFTDSNYADNLSLLLKALHKQFKRD